MILGTQTMRGERLMTQVPVVEATALPGGERIGVLRFDAAQERVFLGPHRHRDLLMLYVERGRGGHRLGSRTQDVTPGDLVLLTPGPVHDAADLAGVTGWAVEFDPLAVGLRHAAVFEVAPGLSLSRAWWANPLLAPFLRAEQHPTAARFTIPRPERRLWSQHLEVMHAEHSERLDGYQEVVAAYLRILLVVLGRVAADFTATLDRRGDATLARVFAVIEQRHGEPLSTADVAAAVGLTPGYLTTLVRRHTGRTVGDWITERKMATARDLLLTTDLTAEQIATRIGYLDPTYFSRRFRQTHGTSLRTWRAAARRPPRDSPP
jgi:AraC family transcriptional regulator, transcriptional activator of pobA